MADLNPNGSNDQQQRLSISDEQVVGLILKITKDGENAHQRRRTRYDHSYDVYRASERRPASLDAWQSKLRVPYAMQVLDTALVNINTGAPRVIVKPRRPDVELNAKAMQVILDYYVGEDHLVEKQPLFAQQGLIYGVTIAKNHWIYQTKKQIARQWMGTPPMENIVQQDMVVRDGPSFEPWNIYDAWWDPSARDVDSSRYVVLRSWLPKEILLENECTLPAGHDKQECDGIYHNVDELLKAGPSGAQQTTAQQRYLTGSGSVRSAIPYKDLFEILEVWTDDTVSVIGSRKVLLRNDPNPYWHSHKPIVIAQTRPDMFEMQGIAETELVDHLQNAQWTLQNMTVDNLHLTAMRGLTYREGGVTNPEKLELKPRFKWPVVDHDDIRPFEVSPLGSDVFQERQRLLADMQLVTGINPYISGSDLSTVDQNTATGVTALQEVASRLLRFKASQLQYKGYQRTFEMWGDMVQQFMDTKTSVQVTGISGEPLWLHVTPDAVQGHFNYVLEGSEESLSRQQERGEAIALLNAFAPLAQLGLVNFKPILERVALSYDFPNPESLFLPPNTPPPAAPTQEQLDQSQQQQGQQQGGQADLYNVRGSQIGEGTIGRTRYLQQGGVQLDPQLAAALAQIGPVR